MKKPVRVVRNIFIVIVGLYFLALCLVYFFQEKLLFHPQVLEQKHQFAFTGSFVEIFIPVDDDVKLHGVLFKAKDSKGLVFYLHGNGGCVDGWGGCAANFTSSGYDLFMLDYRGYGKSGGAIESEAQMNDDTEKAFDFMQKKYKEGTIIIAGYSIGTGPAAHLAAAKNIKALILQAPYYSLTELESEKVPLIPEFVKRYKFNTGNEMLKVNAPIYLFHGTEDKLIPYKHSLKLKETAGDRAVLIPLPGEGHNAINESDLFKEKLSEILKKS